VSLISYHSKEPYWHIISPRGRDCGPWRGKTPADALKHMLIRSFGVPIHYNGTELLYVNDRDADLVGTLQDWSITKLETWSDVRDILDRRPGATVAGASWRSDA
jgi:hypothetical protein